jgi:histidyl-tRNA synthetase
LKERGLLPRFDACVDVVCLIDDEGMRPATIRLVQELREAGCAVEYALTPLKSDKQFKRATELNAPFAVKLVASGGNAGGMEAAIKDLRNRSEQTLPLRDAVAHLKNALPRVVA